MSKYQSTGNNASNGSTLWMGDIDEQMDDRFIKTSFNLMNRSPSNVKIVRNKNNGQPMGYGFITFDSEETAQKVLRELNGQQIPNGTQGKKFRLNITNREENEYSIYVGDLSPEVDDFSLLAAFSQHYPSVCSAKVMVSDGQSRRFGFVRFSQEIDFKNALIHCNNSHILGSNPISVKAAKPRRQKTQNYSQFRPRMHYNLVNSAETFVPQQTEVPAEAVYGTDMNSYYSGLAVSGQQPLWVYPMVPYNALPLNYDPYAAYVQQPYVQQAFYPTCDNMTYSLIPGQIYVDHGHNQLADADKLNEEMIAKNEELYASLENSRWSTPIESEKESKLQ